MLRRFEFTDVLGWSHSRYNTFTTCKRKYYYTYYGKYDGDNLVKINTLKALTSVPLEIGNISHKIIKVLLTRLQKTAEPIDRERFADFSRRKAKEIFRSKVFQETYYKDREEIDFETEIFEAVAKGLNNFLESERLQWLFEEALTEKEDWLIEPGGFGECRIENMKAFCKVDFLFPLGDEIHVLDWKTGEPNYRKRSKHNEQLKGYVTWVSFHFEKKYNEIVPTVAYLLPEYEENRITVNEFDIDDFAIQIRKQTNKMYEYCEEPERNIPLEKEKFELTKNEKICKYCNFRELCDRV